MRFTLVPLVAVTLTTSSAALAITQFSFDHNGSLVFVDSTANRITYTEPKPSIAGTVKQGDTLFVGTIGDQRIWGTAYVFKRGCEPAGYNVSGRWSSDGGFVLRGAAPIREKDGCRIIGYSDTSPNAVLRFKLPYPD